MVRRFTTRAGSQDGETASAGVGVLSSSAPGSGAADGAPPDAGTRDGEAEPGAPQKNRSEGDAVPQGETVIAGIASADTVHVETGEAEMRRAAFEDGGRRAVVDIGSNSVRLVIYEGPARAPIPICNEKALCGLGRDKTEDGGLNPGACDYALATLRRYRSLVDAYGAPRVFAIATSAVRDARNGPAFMAAVAALGFDAQTLSGGEEAALAAQGVISVEPHADGLAGDMGGGSLELVSLDAGRIGDHVSMALGPLNLMRLSGGDLGRARRLIDAELDKTDLLRRGGRPALYTVGGAWRAVARIHMRLRSYPLSVLHRYEMTARAAIEICNLIAHQSRRSLEDIPGIPRRRIDTLPYASLVLKAVLERMNAERVIVSSGGVREGILYRELSPAQMARDPLLEACRFFASRLAPHAAYGEACFPVIDGLFAPADNAGDDVSDDQGDDPVRRLRRAACLLIDTGAYFHPDLRGGHAFETALSAPFVAVSHEERVWLALALYRRYQGRSAPMPNEAAISLLPWELQQSATQCGLAMRFVASYAPKVAVPLAGCRLRLEEDGRLVFRAPADRRGLMGDTPRKRLEALAASFEAEPAEIYDE